MVEIVALLMFVGADQKLTEMMYMPSLKNCLEKRRVATRNSNATYMCSKVKAELSEDMKILKIEKIK
jgi:hypothetical protein